MKMSSYKAVGLAEGFIEAKSEKQVLQAWAFLIKTGMAWTLQGWFGRTAKDFIDAGIISKKGKILRYEND